MPRVSTLTVAMPEVLVARFRIAARSEYRRAGVTIKVPRGSGYASTKVRQLVLEFVEAFERRERERSAAAAAEPPREALP